MKKLKLILLTMITAGTVWGCAQTKTEMPVAAVKVLYVTSAGWFHDYQRQSELLTGAIGHRLKADIDVIVGDIPRLRDEDFSAGYDVLIYNFCHAARRDKKLIENLIAPVRDKGIPLLAVHCTMHSFQHMNEWYDLLGLKTLRHEEQRSFTLEKGLSHPITSSISFPWELTSDELYINLSVATNSKSLISAYGIETKKDHLQAWMHEFNGTAVIATTLGHAQETLVDAQFQQFLASSVAYLAGKLDADGNIESSYRCDENCSITVNTLTANVVYPTQDERSCVIKSMFGEGIPRVESCQLRCNTQGDYSAEVCAEQCQLSEPWLTPESFWPTCQAR